MSDEKCPQKGKKNSPSVSLTQRLQDPKNEPGKKGKRKPKNPKSSNSAFMRVGKCVTLSNTPLVA
jgi:hypothetical protein